MNIDLENHSESDGSTEYKCDDGYSNDFTRILSSDPINNVSFCGDLTATPLYISTVEGESSITVPLPAYIKAFPRVMELEDIQYLWRKGALSIPDTTLRNELIKCYIQHVHPSLPLINLSDFLQGFGKGGGEVAKTSLLLFQALMFAGTAYIDLSYLQTAGYSTRRDARTAFYQKARLLYDFDFEVDRLTVVQSLLLMTYQHETPIDGKDEWHWLGIAISLIYATGLHMDPQIYNMDVQNQRLRKRVWWSCIMRDRLLALGMRRPSRIRDGDYNVPMLAIDDFEIKPLESHNLVFSSECRLVSDTTLQKELALIFISKAELCLCIGHILSTQYTSLVRDQGMEPDQEGKQGSRVNLFPKPLTRADGVDFCEAKLTNWLQKLPAPCRYVTQTPNDLQQRGASLIIERAVLHMVYFSASSTLHRPQIMPSRESSLRHYRELQETSWKRLREASEEITKISMDLQNLEVTRYLPVTGVTILLTAITTHLLDIKTTNNITRKEQARQWLSNCIHILEELRDNYRPADDAIRFVGVALGQVDIDVSSDARSSKATSTVTMGDLYCKIPSTRAVSHDISPFVDPKSVERLIPTDAENPRNCALSLKHKEALNASEIIENEGNSPEYAATTFNNDLCTHYNNIFTDPVSYPDVSRPSESIDSTNLDDGLDFLLSYAGYEEYNMSRELGLVIDDPMFYADGGWAYDGNELG